MLSKRLERIAAMVSVDTTLADIGTDHAFLPIFLIKDKRIKTAIAMDVRKGPLEKAVANISREGLSEYIETRLSDGLEKLRPGEADAVVMAGMGGRLMMRILDRWDDLSSVSEWIFQPQSEIDVFRHYIADRGLHIVEEDMILEDGKYYPMMKTKPGKPYELDELSASFGPLLLANKNEVLKGFLANEMSMALELLAILEKSESKRAKERQDVLNKKCILIANAIDML